MADYVCSHCGAGGCKLWREYQTFVVRLLCAYCAGNDQNIDISDIDSGGTVPSKYDGHRTDQIGCYIPAVPTPDRSAYWGYTSIPDEGVEWWKELPSLPVGFS